MVAVSATQCFAAWAWQSLVLCFSKVSLGFWEAVRLYYIAQTFGSVTPGNLGGDLYRLHAVTVRKGTLTGAVAAIFFQRLTSAQAIALLGTIAAFAIPLSAEVRHALVITLAGLLIGGGVILWLAIMRNKWLLRKIGLGRVTPAQLWQAVSVGFGLALVFHMSGTALGSVLVTAVEKQVPFLTAMAMLMLARLTILLPFTVSGLGVMEGTLAFLFAQVGATAEAGLTVGVLLRLTNIITAIIGVVFLWGERKTAYSSILETTVEQGAED